MNFEKVSNEEFESLMSNAGVGDGASDEEFIQKMLEARSQLRGAEPPPNKASERFENAPKPVNVAPRIVDPPKVVAPPIPEVKNPFDGLKSDNTNYFYVDSLPTKYRFYPEGTKIYGRPLTVLEVKKVSTINEYNSNYIINDILRKTIKGIDINELYIADKIYLMFWLRANTYRDSKYVVDYDCDKCEQTGQAHVDVNMINVEYISDDFSPHREFITPENQKFTFDFMKVGDELKIERFKDINAKLIGGVDDDILNLAVMIRTIEGQEKTIMEKYNWLINSNPGVFSYIVSVIGEFNVGIKPYINIECSGCGGETLMGISFRPEFFLPKYKFE